MFTFDLGNLLNGAIGHPQEAAANASGQVAQANAAVQIANAQANVATQWQNALLIIAALALVGFILWIVLK